MHRYLLLILASVAAQAAIYLDATTTSLRVTSSAAVSVDYVAHWTDTTTTAFTPGTSNGNISTATTTSIVAAPASSTQRRVYQVSLVNKGTSAQVLTPLIDFNGTTRNIGPSVTLGAGESLVYEDGAGWMVLNITGAQKTQATEINGLNGFTADFYKVGTAPEAAGNYYAFSKDSGFPGAWSVGTSGMSGRATDGTTSTDAGCMVIPNAASGNNYLAAFNVTGSVAHAGFLHDWLWVNNGVTVTTTTAQTVNSVAWPSRDVNGATTGVGVNVGVLVVTATTNVGAVTNMTLTYTNSAGTGSRTATIASFPATAVAGTFVPFQLAAGDVGVQSIQSWTLGTSLGGGAVSLVAYRVLLGQTMLLANVGTPQGIPPMNPGIKLYSGTCLMPVGLMSSTTATTVAGTVVVQAR